MPSGLWVLHLKFESKPLSSRPIRHDQPRQSRFGPARRTIQIQVFGQFHLRHEDEDRHGRKPATGF